MTTRDQYRPGAAHEAQVRKGEGDQWTFILTRDLRHPPERVWDALTDPDLLREWAPFDADGNLATTGATVMLTTVNAPQPHVVETTVKRAERPRSSNTTGAAGTCGGSWSRSMAARG